MRGVTQAQQNSHHRAQRHRTSKQHSRRVRCRFRLSVFAPHSGKIRNIRTTQNGEPGGSRFAVFCLSLPSRRNVNATFADDPHRMRVCLASDFSKPGCGVYAPSGLDNHGFYVRRCKGYCKRKRLRRISPVIRLCEKKKGYFTNSDSRTGSRPTKDFTVRNRPKRSESRVLVNPLAAQRVFAASPAGCWNPQPGTLKTFRFLLWNMAIYSARPQDSVQHPPFVLGDGRLR